MITAREMAAKTMVAKMMVAKMMVAKMMVARMMVARMMVAKMTAASSTPSPSQGEGRVRVEFSPRWRVRKAASREGWRRAVLFSAAGLLILVLACGTIRAAPADGAAEKPAPVKPAPVKPVTEKSPASLNDELLKGLGPDPLAEPAAESGKANRPDAAKPDAAKSDQKPAATKPTTKKSAEKPTLEPAGKRIRDPLDDELLKGLDVEGAPAEGEDSDPFVRLNRQMRKVESLIAQSKLDPATQQLQQKIVHDLEELIKKLQQQKSSSSSSSKSSSKQQTARRDKVKQPGAEKGKNGAQDSDQPSKESSAQLRQRKARQAALDQMQDLLGKGVWGQLPQKTRDQMLQSSVDQFLPKYELLIEEYFKAIATPGQNKP
jgi:hypothetical protein